MSANGGNGMAVRSNAELKDVEAGMSALDTLVGEGAQNKSGEKRAIHVVVDSRRHVEKYIKRC